MTQYIRPAGDAATPISTNSATRPPIVVALTLWLGLIFASDGAVSGLIVVSSEPIQHALAVMRR